MNFIKQWIRQTNRFLSLFALLRCVFVQADVQQSAFGELLTVQPVPYIQLQFPYNLNTDYVITSTTGFGSVTQSANFAVLQTGALASSSATLRSKNRLHYQPGQGNVCMFTAVFTQGVAGSTQLIGLGNDQDGFFFGYDPDGDFGILHRRSPNDMWIKRSTFNVDKLDGTGPSGITIDPTFGNVYKIQFKWLGFGSVKFFIENKTDGSWALVHQIQWSNSFVVTTLINPSLQLMAQVNNTTNSTNITLKNPSFVGLTEGIVNASLSTRNTVRGLKTVTANITDPAEPVLTIRNRTTHAGKPNQVVIYPDICSILDISTGNQDLAMTFLLNATLGGSSFTNLNATTSVVEIDTAATTVTGGKELFTFYLASLGKNESSQTLNLKDHKLFLNPGDSLTIACRSIGGNVSGYFSLGWNERF